MDLDDLFRKCPQWDQEQAYIVGVIRTRYRWLQHSLSAWVEVCSQSAVLAKVVIHACVRVTDGRHPGLLSEVTGMTYRHVYIQLYVSTGFNC